MARGRGGGSRDRLRVRGATSRAGRLQVGGRRHRVRGPRPSPLRSWPGALPRAARPASAPGDPGGVRWDHAAESTQASACTSRWDSSLSASTVGSAGRPGRGTTSGGGSSSWWRRTAGRQRSRARPRGWRICEARRSARRDLQVDGLGPQRAARSLVQGPSKPVIRVQRGFGAVGVALFDEHSRQTVGGRA